MYSRIRQTRYFPTPEKVLLLKASLLQGDVALTAWQNWRESVDIEKVDSESYYLLGLLYRNLLAHEVNDDELPRLKGIYRRNWTANQLCLQEIKIICKYFQEAQINNLLLSDVSLLTNNNQNLGNCPIVNIFFLVSTLDLQKAVKLLLNTWNIQNKERFERGYISLNKASGEFLYLQSHLFFAEPQEHTDRELWRYALPCQIAEVSTHVLSPTDRLLYVCLEAFSKHPTRPVRWIAEAVQIINSSEETIDWIRLVTQSQRYELILPLKNMLYLVQEILEISIPDWVLPSLRKMPVSHGELLKYQVWPDNRQLQLKAWILQQVQWFRNRKRE